MQNNNELYHYGILGMKWGHRKAQPVSNLRSRYDSAKSAKKAANKQYSKDYNRANSYSQRHPVAQYAGKHKKEADDRWNKAIDSAINAASANKAYKSVKKERRQAIKNTYKDIQKNTKLGEKMLFSNNTRKLAARYVVDNNMSMKDAKKKANKAAIRNTAIVLGVIGGVTLARSDAGRNAINKAANAVKPRTMILDSNGKVIARKWKSYASKVGPKLLTK